MGSNISKDQTSKVNLLGLNAKKNNARKLKNDGYIYKQG